MPTLKNGDFAGLSGLERLDLSGQPIFYRIFQARDKYGVAHNVFAHLSNLRELDLSDTALWSLPGGMFDGLTSLETLRLVNSGYPDYTAGHPHPVGGVRPLFDRDLFRDLGNLRELDVRPATPLTAAPWAFEPLTSLETYNGEPYTPPPPGPANLTYSAVPIPSVIDDVRVLVSNLQEADSPRPEYFFNSTEDVDYSQAFTTGPNSTGYKLDSIQVDFHSFGDRISDLTVALWSSDEVFLGEPDTYLASLKNPPTIGAGIAEFTAPEGTILEPDTVYVVRINLASGANQASALGTTFSTGETAMDDWSMDNVAYFYPKNSASLAVVDNKVKIAVKETALPLPDFPYDPEEFPTTAGLDTPSDAHVITLDWDATAGISESDITGYRVLRNVKGSRPYLESSQTSDCAGACYVHDYSRYAHEIARTGPGVTSYVDGQDRSLFISVERDTPFFTYYVTAITSDGESFPVQVRAGALKAAPQEAAAPAHVPTLRVSTYGPDDYYVRLEWEAPSDAPTITGYQIQYRQQDDDNWRVLVPNTGNVLSYSFHDRPKLEGDTARTPSEIYLQAAFSHRLAHSSDRQFRVRAMGFIGDSPYDLRFGEWSNVAGPIYPYTGLIDAGNTRPAGIWSNGRHMWVADYADKLLYAYEVSTRRHSSQESIELSVEDFVSNGNPTGIWSNGQTIWVANDDENKVFAYQLDGGSRQRAKEFNLDSANGNAAGMWSDGETMWVADADDHNLYAYRLTEGSGFGQRDTSKEIYLSLSGGNARATGIWSNGETIWVADPDDDKLYAYRLTEGSGFGGREPAKDIDLSAENGAPIGIWSDGVNMWVADIVEDKIYGYSSPYLSATEE